MKAVNLHRLIQGMSKTEKRFFTLFTSMYEKEDNKKIFTSIYEYLDNQAVYDEEAFLHTFEHVDNRAVIQVYLADVILNCLVILKRDDDMSFQISLAQELLDRGFSKEAQRKIDKLKPICEQRNDRRNLVSLNMLEIIIIHMQMQKIIASEQILAMQKKISGLYSDLLNASLLAEKHSALSLIKTKFIHSKITTNEINEYIDGNYSDYQIAENEARATTLGYQALDTYYNEMEIYYNIKSDIYGSFEVVKKQLNIVEKNYFKNINKKIIIKYANLLTIAIKLNENLIVVQTLEKLKNANANSPELKTIKYYSYFNNLASYAVAIQQPILLINELDNLIKFLDSPDNLLVDENATMLCSSILLCFFYSKNEDVYFDFLQKMQHLYILKKGMIFYYHIKLTELFIHFKLGNHTIVQSGLLHLYRCFKDSPPTKEFMVKIYKILKRLHSNPDKKPNNYAQDILEVLPPTNEDLFVTVVRAYFTDKLS
jgi:hypothetical protein